MMQSVKDNPLVRPMCACEGSPLVTHLVRDISIVLHTRDIPILAVFKIFHDT